MKRYSILIGVITMVCALVMPFDGFAQVKKSEKEFKEVLWEVKAIRSTTNFMKVVAIDKMGRQYDIYAIQDSDETSLLDVKVFKKKKQLAVKMLVGEKKYHPVKAIDDKGNILDIKAITSNGLILPVKGVSKSGNIIHIRAINDDFIFYNLVAVSPDGETNDVKGIKLSKDTVETALHGVEVYAHIKALKQ